MATASWSNCEGTWQLHTNRSYCAFVQSTHSVPFQLLQLAVAPALSETCVAGQRNPDV